MTSVLIIGGGGMIGQKLALSYKNNDTVSLLDMAFPESSDVNAKKIVGSVTDTGILEKHWLTFLTQFSISHLLFQGRRR